MAAFGSVTSGNDRPLLARSRPVGGGSPGFGHPDPYRPVANVRSAGKALLVKVALARWKVEVVTRGETCQDRLDVSGQLQSLK